MNNLGQLFMTGISGTSLTKDEESFIQNENIGGVILFSKNYENPAQLAELINSIQVLRYEYPLFIGVDQEGGRVVRFKEHFSFIPPMLDMSLLDSPKICFHLSSIIASELAACGVNLNFGPVCDIFNNEKNKVIGDRAFGKDSDTVQKFISSAIRGFQTNKVMACAKHFPGHGNTLKDSHFTLPVIKKSYDELEREEFQPFIKAVKSRVEFVMMGHLLVESIDPETPCTFSKKAYDIIRDLMKFNKIIITDDMQMNAVVETFGVEEAAVRSLKAGADIVLYRDLEVTKQALEGVKKAQKTKELKNDLLQKKYERVLNTKKEHLSEYKPVYIPEVSKKIGLKPSEIFITEILDKISKTKKA